MRPRDPVELLVHAVWADVLGRPWVSVRDTFASLGGDGDARRRMLERVAREAGLGARHDGLANDDTVEAMAATLKRTSEVIRARARGFWARNVEAAPGATRPPLHFFHGSPIGGLPWFKTMASLGADQPVYGISPHAASDEPTPISIEAIAADHVRMARAIQPAGPYLLGGHCNGALTALEAARQLIAGGEAVLGVLLMAPMLPATYRTGAVGLVVGLRARLGRALGLAGPVDAEDVYERYSKILISYRPSPLPVRTTILWPRQELWRYRAPSDRLWRRVLPDAARVELPGTHIGCVTDHRDETAHVLRQAIDALLAEASPLP